MTRAGAIPETLRRHWLLLERVPRAPKKVDAGTLETHLKNEGIEVTRRSLQRDLEALAKTFPGLVCDNKSKPYGWSWALNAPSLDVPPMSLQSAVTIEMLWLYLRRALPLTSVRSLEPLFQRARKSLGQRPDAKLARWPGKVRVIPRGLALRTPDVPESILEPVYEALLEERQLDVSYQGRHAADPRQMTLSPLALVLRHEVLMLIARVGGKVYQLMLHRMHHAVLLDTKAVAPKGFNIDKYLASGEVGFRFGDEFVLEARVDPLLTFTVTESPLSADQTVTLESSDDGAWSVLRATVPDNLETRGWISSYGPRIEVIGPDWLRTEYAQMYASLAQRYGVPPVE